MADKTIYAYDLRVILCVMFAMDENTEKWFEKMPTALCGVYLCSLSACVCFTMNSDRVKCWLFFLCLILLSLVERGEMNEYKRNLYVDNIFVLIIFFFFKFIICTDR